MCVSSFSGALTFGNFSIALTKICNLHILMGSGSSLLNLRIRLKIRQQKSDGHAAKHGTWQVFNIRRTLDENRATFCSPTQNKCRFGEWRVETNEEATVYVKELDPFVSMQLFEDTPLVLSLRQLCEDHGCSSVAILAQVFHPLNAW